MRALTASELRHQSGPWLEDLAVMVDVKLPTMPLGASKRARPVTAMFFLDGAA